MGDLLSGFLKVSDLLLWEVFGVGIPISDEFIASNDWFGKGTIGVLVKHVQLVGSFSHQDTLVHDGVLRLHYKQKNVSKFR